MNERNEIARQTKKFAPNDSEGSNFLINLYKSGIINIFAFVIMILLFSIATYLLYIANLAKIQTETLLDKTRTNFAQEGTFNFALCFLKDALQRDKNLLLYNNFIPMKGNKTFFYQNGVYILCNYLIEDKTPKTNKKRFISGIFNISTECMLKLRSKILAKSQKSNIVGMLENIEITNADRFQQFIKEEKTSNKKFILTPDTNHGFLMSRVRRFDVQPYFGIRYEDLVGKDTVKIPLKNAIPHNIINLNNKTFSVSNFNLLIVFRSNAGCDGNSGELPFLVPPEIEYKEEDEESSKAKLEEQAKKEHYIFEVIDKNSAENSKRYEFKLFFSDKVKQFFPQCSGYQVVFGKDWPFAGVRSCILSSAISSVWNNFLISVRQFHRRFISNSGSLEIPYNKLLEVWISGEKDYLSLLTPNYDMSSISEYHFGSYILEENLVDNIDKKEIILNNKDVEIVGLFVFEGIYTDKVLTEIKNKGVFENELFFGIRHPLLKERKVLDIYVKFLPTISNILYRYGFDGYNIWIYTSAPIFKPITIEKIELLYMKGSEIIQ